MNSQTLTEQQVINKLIASAKSSGEISPRVVVVSRTQKERSLQRIVRFALIVTTNNETLLEALIGSTLDDDLDFNFIGSEANLQGDLEVDYMYFEAKIMYKNGGQT